MVHWDGPSTVGEFRYWSPSSSYCGRTRCSVVHIFFINSSLIYSGVFHHESTKHVFTTISPFWRISSTTTQDFLHSPSLPPFLPPYPSLPSYLLLPPSLLTSFSFSFPFLSSFLPFLFFFLRGLCSPSLMIPSCNEDRLRPPSPIRLPKFEMGMFLRFVPLIFWFE